MSRKISIFISSPGDVSSERAKTEEVAAQLQRFYGDRVELRTILWESLPLASTQSFQQGIDAILKSDEHLQIAVFILWGKLGTPISARTMTKEDGSEYRSGTEREYDLMRGLHERTKGERPHIMAYVRQDTDGLYASLKGKGNEEIKNSMHQRELLEHFLNSTFKDSDGRNSGATFKYHDPTAFAGLLLMQLRLKLDDLLDGAPMGGFRWSEAPYRGLEFFDIPHGAIFHGRDQEVLEITERLRRREQDEECSFVVIVGASGSGKSSLARAGVAVNLLKMNLEDGIAEWRCAVLNASAVNTEQGGNIFRNLAQSLTSTSPCSALPEINALQHDEELLAQLLESDPKNAVQLVLTPAWKAAEKQVKGGVRLLLVIDQFEDLFNEGFFTSTQRTRFLVALEALARSGMVRVLATLRGDSYSAAQQDENFIRLKGEHGHYDLLPPGAHALQALISQPARAAGLRFETRPGTSHSLAAQLFDDTAGQPDALPLLQHALLQLYEQRDHATGTMTFTAYEAMGGIEGAIAHHAENAFSTISGEREQALDAVMRHLVTPTKNSTAGVAIKPCPGDLLINAHPQAGALVDCFLKERLLVTYSEDGQEHALVRLAHFKLLERWERLSKWLVDPSVMESLRRKQRLEMHLQEWLEVQKRDGTVAAENVLLRKGPQLEDGRDLLENHRHHLSPAEVEFVENSLEFHARASRAEARRNAVRRTIFATLTGVSCAASVVAMLYSRQLNQQKTELVENKNELVLTNKSLKENKTILETQAVELKSKQTELQAKQGELEKTNLSLEKNQKELQEKNVTLTSTIAELQATQGKLVKANQETGDAQNNEALRTSQLGRQHFAEARSQLENLNSGGDLEHFDLSATLAHLAWSMRKDPQNPELIEELVNTLKDKAPLRLKYSFKLPDGFWEWIVSKITSRP